MGDGVVGDGARWRRRGLVHLVVYYRARVRIHNYFPLYYHVGDDFTLLRNMLNSLASRLDFLTVDGSTHLHRRRLLATPLHLDNTTITDTALERLKNAKSVLYFRQLPCHLLQNNDKSTQS